MERRKCYANPDFMCENKKGLKATGLCFIYSLKSGR